jgi:hypothetical protein
MMTKLKLGSLLSCGPLSCVTYLTIHTKERESDVNRFGRVRLRRLRLPVLALVPQSHCVAHGGTHTHTGAGSPPPG